MKSKQPTILLLAALCGLYPLFPVWAQEPHADHHPHSEATATSPSYQVSIAIADGIQAGVPFAAAIHIRDSQGKAVENFDIFQEKLMHLILVDSALGSFQHLHPVYVDKGSFHTDILLPEAGNHFLFSDFMPTGDREQLAVIEITSAGTPSPKGDAEPVLTTEKIVGDTKVVMTLAPQPVTARGETIVAFELSDAESLRPLVDIQPYLGEKGHLVVLRKTSPLTAKDYIHAHAVKEEASSAIRFTTRFPVPGFYRLWCQFNRGGTVQTADFWVEVE
ncbi:MAG: hypothetical protein GXY54_07660 [Deltaproteobacteria bacterium]|nr:hypothetical protein [Deltaproteobacteria bacterium]